MQLRAAGDHAVGMDIMMAIMKALREAINKLGMSPEADVAMEMMMKGKKMFQRKAGGQEDSVDPMQRVQQAIAMNRMAQARPGNAPGGMPGMPPMGGVPAPMPARGPVPMGGGPA